MRFKWYLLAVVPLTALLSTQAEAATVAVMPVHGVNLSQGQCDAIGFFFANAFARETNVAVASPMDTRPLLAQGRTPSEVAAQLGAAEFVDLRAAQMEGRVTLAGVRYGREGNEIFRSETAASSLDDMEAATASLARSLAWRQPIAFAPMAAPGSPPTPEASAADSKSYPKAMGVKAAMVFARSWSANRTYAPMMSLQFDGRIGSRSSFIEIGGGVTIPTSSSSGSDEVQMGGLFAELGGSVYLSDGSIAPYLGAGVSPRLWFANKDINDGATCTVYGQAGINFTRDSRARLYMDLRFSQYVLGLSQSSTYYYSSGETASGVTYYPMELSLQVGIGW